MNVLTKENKNMNSAISYSKLPTYACFVHQQENVYMLKHNTRLARLTLNECIYNHSLLNEHYNMRVCRYNKPATAVCVCHKSGAVIQWLFVDLSHIVFFVH